MTDYSSIHASAVHTRCRFALDTPSVEMVTVIVVELPGGNGPIYCEDEREAADFIELYLDGVFDRLMVGEDVSPTIKIEQVTRAFLLGLKEVDWI